MRRGGRLDRDPERPRLRGGRQPLAATAAGIPLKRNPTGADIVNAILYFLSAEAAFLTGVALDVDGGMLSTAAIPGLEN